MLSFDKFYLSWYNLWNPCFFFLGREMEDSSATDEDSEDENQNGDEIEGKVKILSINKPERVFGL